MNKNEGFNKIATRVSSLNRMNNIILTLGDDDIWDEWTTYGLPDEATVSQLLDIAEDDEQYEGVVSVFLSIVESES